MTVSKVWSREVVSELSEEKPLVICHWVCRVTRHPRYRQNWGFADGMMGLGQRVP